MRALLALVAGAALAASVASVVSGAEIVGVLTELHVHAGRVEVRSAAGGDWQAPRPLLTINAGDQVRVTGGARAVIVFMGGQRATTVTQENSPFVAAAPAQPSVGERVTSALAFLLTPRARTVTFRQELTVRSAKTGILSSVVLITPRATLVGPEGLVLEWSGPSTNRYTARIVTADRRVLWEKKDLPPTPLTLAPGDVRLVPGHYRWEVEAEGVPGARIQSVVFDVATDDVVRDVRSTLEAVDARQYPPVSGALLRASGLMREHFYADARRELLKAIAATPDEPTLHVLLADVYVLTKLNSMAEGTLDRADALSGTR